jgi:hypothetical protein
MQSRLAVALMVVASIVFMLVGGIYLSLVVTHSYVAHYRPGWTIIPTDDKYLIWSRPNNGFLTRATRIGPYVVYTP